MKKKKKKTRGRNKQETDSTISYRSNKPRGILGEHEEVFDQLEGARCLSYSIFANKHQVIAFLCN